MVTDHALGWIQGALLVPIVVGAIFSLLSLGTVLWYLRRRPAAPQQRVGWPAVTISRGEVVARGAEITGRPGRGVLARRGRHQPL